MIRSLFRAVVLLGVFLGFVACSDEQNPVKQYGNTMVDSLKTTKKVEGKVDLLTMQRSIQEFQAANGRYPADLNEVAAFNGMTLENDQYEYDPATGLLTQKK